MTKKMLFRYVVTGVSVAAIYVLLHSILSFYISMDKALASGIAIVVAIGVQYWLHSAFTFESRVSDRAQIMRFIATIFLGLIVSQIVVGYLGPILGIAEILSVFMVIFVLPVSNFLFFSLWVFRPALKDNNCVDSN
ncbi:MAG: GtrA family protein [Pseudomonadota bacterium]